MRKIVLFVLIMSATYFASAQQNVVKLGLGSALQSDINLKYERAFGGNHSVQLAVLWDTPENLNFGQFYNDPEAANSSGKLSGFALVPEYRYYFGSKGAPRGFYAGLYARYRNRTLAFVDNFGTDVEIDAKLTLGNFGGGIGCGAQWLIKDKISIDWYIFGIGYNSFGLKAQVKPTDPNDFAQLKQDILDEIENVRNDPDINEQVGDSPEFDLILDEFKSTVENTSDDVAFKTPRIPFGLLDFRTGLSIGYAF